jgi:exosortase D (VPLPA-CTERM-specific)
MIKAIEEIMRIKPISWMKAGVYALGIILIYYSALVWMIFHDWAKEDNSHCYLIPFVVLYLLWEKRSALRSCPSVPSWKGAVPLLFGLGLFWVGEFGGEFFTLYLSLWLVVVGLIWLHNGWRKLREMGFALFMMLTMFPFPNFINTKILVNLRIISSDLGVKMLHLCGITAYREGNVIELAFTKLQVVDACSGLRFVLSLGILSLLMAYLFRGSLWKKAILFLSSLPLAIFSNSIRIAVTGILYNLWGASVAEGFFHGFSGWLIFMVTVPVLLLEMWILSKTGGKTGSAIEPIVNEKRILSPAIEQMPESPPSSRSAMLQPVFITSLVLLAATFALSRGVEFREKVPLKKSFNEFPLTIGEWTGTRQSMEQLFIDALHFSDYIMVSYRTPKGPEIDFYVAYYETQLKGETTHSPETCLPGSGWSFEKAGVARITDGDGRTMEVNRALMEKSGRRQLMYFWFPQRGRILTSLIQVKIYSFWDALTRQRTDGALVRIITPVYESERLEDAEKRLQRFIREIAPALGEFIPG